MKRTNLVPSYRLVLVDIDCQLSISLVGLLAGVGRLPRGVLPYLGYTGTCCWTGYGFFYLAVLNRVYNLLRLCLKQGMVYYNPRDFIPDCEQSLSFLSQGKARLKEHVIERRTTSGVCLFLICIISTELNQLLPDITMSSINIRSFSGQECYCCRYPLI